MSGQHQNRHSASIFSWNFWTGQSDEKKPEEQPHEQSASSEAQHRDDDHKGEQEHADPKTPRKRPAREYLSAGMYRSM